MAYTKNTWIDQDGQVKYSESVDGDYKIFTPNFEDVTEIGTPVNATNMNHIENGIADCYTDLVQRKSTSSATGNATTPVYIKDNGVVEVCSREIPDVSGLNSTKTISLSGASNTINLSSSNSINITTTGVTKTVKLTGDVTGSAIMSTSNINTVSISTTLANSNKIDGQWVNSFHELSTATSAGTYNIDISSYLPSGSGYIYEVQLIAGATHSGDTTKRQTVRSSIISETTAFNLVGSYADRSKGSIILPVGTNKIITYEIDSKLSSASLYMIAYRRIGSNT